MGTIIKLWRMICPLTRDDRRRINELEQMSPRIRQDLNLSSGDISHYVYTVRREARARAWRWE